MTLTASGALHRYSAIVGLLLLAACDFRPHSDSSADPAASVSTDSAAVAVATQRLAEHGQAGFSVDDAKRTQEWFTPELFALLVRDMSDTNGVGYLDWDPFTSAQDIVGPMRFEESTRGGYTVRVRFSREGYEHKRESVTLAMRLVDGQWRIANFLYPDNSRCHQDLAVGLERYARASDKRTADDCG